MLRDRVGTYSLIYLSRTLLKSLSTKDTIRK